MLDVRHFIDKSKLDEREYLVSLLREGVYSGVITESDCERVRDEALLILADKVKEKNGEDSSSIRSATAEELMKSIFYSAGISMKAYPHPDAALEALIKQKNGLEIAYIDGQRRIQKKLTALKRLHRALKKELFETPNVFYSSTASDAIDGFFKLYKPEYYAHLTHITADYPTYAGEGRLCGIEFIEKYLKHIACENCFCRCFEPNTVHKMMLSMNNEYADYTQTPLNIFGYVFISALCCVITAREPKSLSPDIDKLGGMSADAVLNTINEAAVELENGFALSDSVRKYITICLPKIKKELMRAVDKGNIEATVLTAENHAGTEGRVIIRDGETMSAAEYEKLLTSVMYADSSEEKVALMRGVHSYVDLLELLRDAEPEADEIRMLLGTLGDEAIAALYSAAGNGSFSLGEQDALVAGAFEDYIGSLGTSRASRIRELSRRIEFR